MSRTLSKVLIICALVVVLPLMIAGTAFAAYFSINATVSIEIFVDQVVDGGRAEVSYKDQTGRIDKKLEVTDGHLKKVTFKTSAVGYDFVGWYAGTAKAYEEALQSGKEINYVVKSKDAKVEMTDYQNLVAVFAAKHFTVGYKYIQTPLIKNEGEEIPGTGVEVTEAPSSKNGLIVDGKADTVGKTEFVYGEKLHTLEFEGHPEYTFDGWYVGDGTTKYTKATFVETGDIVLTGKWVDSKHITLTYLNEKGEELTQDKDGNALKTDLYAGHSYDLVDPMKFDYSEGFVQAGYSYVWKDVETGSALTQINSEKDVVVKISKTPVVYKAKVVYDETNFTLNEKLSNEVTFSIENKNTLDAWNDASNWTSTYSFWHFDHLTYNGSKVENFGSIIDSIIAANPHNSTEITINLEKRIDVTSIRIDSLGFKSHSDTTLAFTGDVYKDKSLISNGSLSDDRLGLKVFDVFGMTNSEGTLADFYNAANNQGKVEYQKFLIKLGDETSFKNLNFIADENTTINDLIEFIYSKEKNVSKYIENGALMFDLVVCFK